MAASLYDQQDVTNAVTTFGQTLEQSAAHALESNEFPEFIQS